MDYEAVAAGLQSAIPFNTHLGLRVDSVSPGEGVVELPDDQRLRNHAGTQHAGALFAAGEAASGAAFVGAFAERLGDVMPLAQRAEITYRRPASGPVTAIGRFEADPSAVLADLEERGTVRFPVHVHLADGEGDTVATMTVDWHVRRNG